MSCVWPFFTAMYWDVKMAEVKMADPGLTKRLMWAVVHPCNKGSFYVSHEVLRLPPPRLTSTVHISRTADMSIKNKLERS